METTAVSGPPFCIFTPPVGAVFEATYWVERKGDIVNFTPPDPIDWDSFTAKINGLDFAATNPTVGSAVGMCTHYLQGSSLSGSFAPDNNSFTAVEAWSFTLDSGEVKTVMFAWTGTRL